MVVIWRGLVLAVALLVMMRIMGKRFVGELTPIDFAVGIVVGTIAGSATIDSKIPLWAGLAGLAIWVAVHWVNTQLSITVKGYNSWLVGKPLVLVENGRYQLGALRAANLSVETVRSELQVQRVNRIEQVKRAVLEPSGKISVELQAHRSAPDHASS